MIQVYTGNGKGKTTAALGLALRASGAGLKVYICQFAKGRKYSEHNSLKKIKNIKVEQFGRSCFIKRKPAQKDIQLAEKGLENVKRIICKKVYDMVILDEINIAVKLNLIKPEDVLNIIKQTPKRTELILTGRYAHPKIIKLADLVSQINEKKHYFKRGVLGRRGIEF
ncbi:MAG: cob(I)yrinic acid a,c-diamide adenosyltransferase [Candidatus Omnitrophica bacterium]|nr:cob(I)yrinic acid a,c-diamide adenosyltransferase [Candidatus Omnitrophota bacterium]